MLKLPKFNLNYAKLVLNSYLITILLEHLLLLLEPECIQATITKIALEKAKAIFENY